MTEKQIQAIVDTLQNQRNAALNAIVEVQGEKAALQEQLDKALAELAQLEDLHKETSEVV